MKTGVLFAAAAVGLITGASEAPAQEAPIKSFEGKTIRIIVGAPPGGSYDFYARLAADMLKAHLPRIKSVIVENRPGGGGVVAVGWFYSQAPRDGTVLGVLPETIAYTQLMEPDVGKWRAEEFNYIGSFVGSNSVFVRRRDSPSKTVEEMKKQSTVVGCTGTTAQSYQYPALLKALAGFKFRMICGYPGAGEYTLALERGEIDLVSSGWNSWRVTHKDKLAKGDLVPVIQVGLSRNRELSDVPLMQELVQDSSAKRVLEFMSAGSAIGRALVAPPGLNSDRTALLRKTFDEMVRDTAMQDLAAKRGLELEPSSGIAVQSRMKAIVDTPTDLVSQAVEAFRN